MYPSISSEDISKLKPRCDEMNERVVQNALASAINCGVCGQPLVYATKSVIRACTLCGTEVATLIYCRAGHYVCDKCHSKAALEVLHQVLNTTHSCDPAVIIEQVLL